MTSQAQFMAEVLPFTLAFEGGFQCLRADRGNWTSGAVGKGVLRGTNRGISAMAYPGLDIRALGRAEVAALYWRDYCAKPGFDRLALGPCLATFDAGVMSGPGRAAAWQATAAALPEATQIRAVSALRLRFCQAAPQWSRFGKGWQARIAACELRALKAVTPVVPQVSATPPQPAVAPSSPKGLIMRLMSTLAAGAAALFGTVAAAQAADIVVAPYATAIFDQIVAPVGGTLALFVATAAGNAARRWLSQQDAARLADNVDRALNWAIAWGVKEAEKRITEEGFIFKVDGIVADLVVGYANRNFAGLLKKAGGVLAERIQARLPSHPDLLELKSLVATGVHPALPRPA